MCGAENGLKQGGDIIKEKKVNGKKMSKKRVWCLILGVALAQGNELEWKIANMFLLGFEGTAAASSSAVRRDVCSYGLGGVVLFDRNPSGKKSVKNIVSPEQLKRLTAELKRCRHQPLIAVDQEGGAVERLKSSAGFDVGTPRADAVAKAGKKAARKWYLKMARGLKDAGINYNLAPVADLALNPRNGVIVRWGRSYGKNPEKVADFDRIFILAMHRYGILTSLKHFPGHGSSTGDTHQGFVDVSRQWRETETKPYAELIREGIVDSIMVAHLFNRRLDERYPASLSRKTIEGFLRRRLGFDGVVITDDLQMGAIAKHYSLRETIRLAINAGNDLLLFGNQIDPKLRVSLKELIAITAELVRRGKIPLSRIEEANRHIEAMKRKIGLR